MTYQQHLHRTMKELATHPSVKFIGYNTRYGHQMYGTLKSCEDSCIETPVAENLMMGLAMGMSLRGYLPIVCVERSNFLLPMADSIINHLYAMPKMSGKFNFSVILRVVIAHNKPLDPGIQHTGDYTDIIKNHTDIPVLPYEPANVGIYQYALELGKPICITERKELYETHYSTTTL